MTFELVFTDEARDNLKKLEDDSSKKAILKAVRKTLGLMETNLRHPGLKTHKYQSIKGPQGEEVFEDDEKNKRSGAYRVFRHYGPEKNQISIVAIVPHP